MKETIAFFKRLIRNENSFDALFCDILSLDGSTIYFNHNFADDPVFNHITLDEKLLDEKGLDITPSLSSAVEAANKLSVPATLFIEDFWSNSAGAQSTAIDAGFRVIEKMKILSKHVGNKSVPSKPEGIEIVITEDVRTWNEVFEEAYSIPESWTSELLSREESIIKNRSATLLLAKVDGTPAGCLLLKKNAEKITGVYCVGTIPEMRSSGVARALLAFSEDHAMGSGSDTLTLQTIVRDNVTPMYLKLGYEEQYERNVLQRM